MGADGEPVRANMPQRAQSRIGFYLAALSALVVCVSCGQALVAPVLTRDDTVKLAVETFRLVLDNIGVPLGTRTIWLRADSTSTSPDFLRVTADMLGTIVTAHPAVQAVSPFENLYEYCTSGRIWEPTTTRNEEARARASRELQLCLH